MASAAMHNVVIVNHRTWVTNAHRRLARREAKPNRKRIEVNTKLISVAYLSTVGNKFQINKNIHIPSYQLELLCQVNMPNKTTIEANYIK